ncbi:peptidylprolyl isomerase [Psychroserpens sp. XS_ASV72]|uniref:peptidylprolyl isomerase n=1 Tax=Psychroserpens sp. XS_ASV72 TaxID=3241293 RepID=UPI0035184536
MKQFICALSLCFTVFASAQVKPNDVLFTVDDEPVLASEFIRVYKKNLDLVKDESQKDIDAYLDLFINYQLKVKEAKRLKLDEEPKYVREFTNYKNQLVKNYLTDNKVTDVLVEEAYQRSTEDVKASHILIRLDENVTDTTAVYNRLLDLRARVLDEGFEKVQKEVHDGKEVFAENLGYFSTFKMVYPFETAAYNTKVGEISKPFRTRFGFHIVKVEDKRPSLGEVTVAHIMVALKQKDSLLNPEKRINEIYKKLQQGEAFESLAKQFSDDKSSSNKGGRLSAFTGGQLSSPEFEEVAFSLSEDKPISKPFKTEFGWHIVKFIDKKGIQPFEEVKPLLESKVRRDSRSKLIQSAQAEKLKKSYNVVDNEQALKYFESIITDDYFKRAWVVPTDLDKSKTFLTIKDKVLTYDDFAQYLFSNQRNYVQKKMSAESVVRGVYKAYLEAQLMQYQKDNLENENQEFANVLKEYRDGLLLFDLMEKEVWNAAAKDTVGLKAYYEKHKENYMWQDRVEGIMFSSAKESVIKDVKKSLETGAKVDDIESKFNTEKTQNVIATKGVFQVGDQNLPTDFKFAEGVSDVYEHHNAFHVIKANKILPKGQKTLDEAKGKVISDYQNQIETDWIETLNQRYNVKINDKILKKVKSEISN